MKELRAGRRVIFKNAFFSAYTWVKSYKLCLGEGEKGGGRHMLSVDGETSVQPVWARVPHALALLRSKFNLGAALYKLFKVWMRKLTSSAWFEKKSCILESLFKQVGKVGWS